MKTIRLVVLSITVAALTVARAGNPTPASLDLATLIDCAGQPAFTLDQLTRDAVSENQTVAENAIRMLRARGPEGLRALFDAHAETLKQQAFGTSPFKTESPDHAWLLLKAALDGVGQQRDCYASQLYWYTDFEQAKVAAKAEAKPILSLRLLGKLDEEFSCANSRFFRTTLYANAEVSQFLREHFILHWKSVRPVPRVTIDFGDGRRLERTLTGNSIHYVLDSDGRVIDALPGLYGPNAFRQWLRRAEDVAQQSSAAAGDQREAMLRNYHRSRFATLNAQLGADLQTVSASSIFVNSITAAPVALASEPPTAQAAARIAIGKGRVETPILNQSLPSAPKRQSGSAIDDATWAKIAALHEGTSKLDDASRLLIYAKNPSASAAARITMSKTFVESPLLRQIRNLERSISEDTVRNEYLLHSQIHAWLASGEIPAVENLNQRVYTELFLTPDSDPWLGLAPRDTFTALENDGVISSSSQISQIKPSTQPDL